MREYLDVVAHSRQARLCTSAAETAKARQRIAFGDVQGTLQAMADRIMMGSFLNPNFERLVLKWVQLIWLPDTWRSARRCRVVKRSFFSGCFVDAFFELMTTFAGGPLISAHMYLPVGSIELQMVALGDIPFGERPVFDASPVRWHQVKGGRMRFSTRNKPQDDTTSDLRLLVLQQDETCSSPHARCVHQVPDETTIAKDKSTPFERCILEYLEQRLSEMMDVTSLDDVGDKDEF